MELSDYRARIDQIDRQLVELFAQRMNTAAGIAAYKKEHGLPVLDPVREREKLLDVAAQAPEDMRDYTASLYTMLFELSRCYQGRLLGSTSPLTTEIQAAIDQTPNLFPSNVSVACQGVAGPIPSWPATSCSSCLTSCTSLPLRRCLPLSKGDCAATVCCRWKTAPPAASTPFMT